MACPRCGHQAEGMARACPACGYILPFSLRQHRQLRASAGVARGGVSAPLHPAGNASGQPPPESSPSVDLDELAGWPTSLPPTRASASGQLTGPLRLERSDDAPHEHTAILPVVAPSSAHEGGASGIIPFSFAPDMRSESAVDDAQTPLLTTTSMLAALGAGALLKGGRYRLAKRFSTVVSSGRRGEPEPPLYIASDLERPSRRVLIQELPLADVRESLADRAHRHAAARLRAAANQGVAPDSLDDFTERGRRFLVFEFPEGEQLSDILRRNTPAAADDVIQLGLRLLDAVAVLDDMKPHLIHANICPDNVIMRPDGELAFVGFSPTVLVQGVIPLEHGSAGGVRGYAAPEQQRGQADVRADLFAIGAILHYAATGQRPNGVAGAAPGSARALNPQVSEGLDDVLNRALRPAPAQRIGSVDEFRSALLALLPRGQVVPAHTSGGLSATATGRAVQPALPGPLAALRASLEQPSDISLVRSRTLRVVLLCLLLLALVTTGTLYVARSHANGPAPLPEATVDPTASALFNQSHIGVSDGQALFDTARPNAAVKRRGAQALLHGDTRAAYLSFKQASDSDPADVEAAIYAEDARIALARTPVLTIVLGASFGDPTSASDSMLRGAFLAQQRINSLELLPGTTQLRILIANAGANPSGAASAAQLIAKSAAASPAAHVIGVVGWPDAARTNVALPALGTLPYLVPGADVQGVSGPGYFALGPSDAQQGAALARAINAALSAHSVFVLADPADTRGTSLASAFTAAVGTLAGRPLYITRQEALLDSPADPFAQPALDAVYSGADTILIAGGAADVIGMARALRALEPRYPWSVGRIRLLAPTWAFTPSLLGLGSDATALAVRADPSAVLMVKVASLASSDEWTAAGIGEGQQPPLFAAYTTRFGAAAPAAGLLEPDASVILAYDALQLLAATATQATAGAKLPDANGVRGVIASLRPGAAFQGVGGAIAFDGSGVPANKALALLSLMPISTPSPGGPIATPSTITILGGTSAFCAAAGCISR